jgi:hypothetical protein
MPRGKRRPLLAPTMKTTTTYRDAAVALWGEAGAFAHDRYDRYRHELYLQLPDELPIVIGITAYAHCAGLTASTWKYGPRITLESRRFWQGREFVADVLMHEMLHAWLGVMGRDTSHDSRAWYAAVNRLSPLVLGRELGAVRGAARRSVRVPNPLAGEPGEPKTLVRKVANPDAVPHGDVARWPISFRPADYPTGEPIDCPIY